MKKYRQKKIPGILVAAMSSGSGKTVVSCALMSAFRQKGYTVKACKCGPDYIDPLFHREALGVDSCNLDLFFLKEEDLRKIYVQHAADAQIVITEGVMGYYDGMSADSARASSYHTAKTLGLPVILVVSAKGASLTLAASVKGIAEFRPDSRIKGVILNRVSPGYYPKLKEMLERELDSLQYDIPVLGFIPGEEEFHFESRHLGLVTPEGKDVKNQLCRAGNLISQTVDLEKIMEIAETYAVMAEEETERRAGKDTSGCTVAVARDRAFCFYYKENLALLEDLGCRLVFFSPLSDKELPEADGLILGGGYPELYAEELSKNRSMCTAVRDAVRGGMPCLAECGGFMYLHEILEDQSGVQWKMAGVVKGKVFPTGKSVRFGYVEVTGTEEKNAAGWLKSGERIRGHEFHYWDSTDNGDGCTAFRTGGRGSWPCIHADKNLFAGFPHLYFPSLEKFAERFAEKAGEYHKKRVGRDNPWE